jgi:NADH-quinone oxidoreductase subunit G
MEDKAQLIIDGHHVAVPKGTLLWEAAKHIGIDIPIFCYHSKLGPVGVCRMCLVEVEGMPKLTTACTTPVADGMVVYTRSPDVEKAQRGILEFLLINHPLDCPICDRGGECPLQDQTFTYGPGVSRFIEPKRHFKKPIPLGPTITIDRERCIMCWRCVRFTTEVAEDNQLILIDRGSETYIGTYEDQPYVSNFSGNVIELCPVGALTSSKQRFAFRPWEMKAHPSICPHCPMGCNIDIDVRDAQEVVRFRSRTNDAIDDGWLCDRGRFGYDFIGSPHRLKTPLIRREDQLVPASWQTAYRTIAENLQRIARLHGSSSIAGLASPRLCNEDLFTFKRFMREVIGTDAIDHWPRSPLQLTNQQLVAMERINRLLVPIDALDRAKVILIVDADPSKREPVMELRIRKAVNKRGARLIHIGTTDIPLSTKAEVCVRYAPEQFSALLAALTGQITPPPSTSEDFQRAREILTAGDETYPIVVLYDDSFPAIEPKQAPHALEALANFIDALAAHGEIGAIPMLITSNDMAARDFGLLPPNGEGGLWGEPIVDRLLRGEFRAAYIVGADPLAELPMLKEALTRLDFLVVQELMLTETAHLADVVLPAASFAEKVGTVTNTSRRVQLLCEAVPSPGIARPDWQILVELSQRWDYSLTYSSPEQILADIATSVPGYSALYRPDVTDLYSLIGPQGIQLEPELASTKASCISPEGS